MCVDLVFEPSGRRSPTKSKSDKFYSSFRYLPYEVKAQRKVAPRDVVAASDRYVNLSEVTNDDITSYILRDLADFDKLDHPNVKYEANPNFNTDKPEGYQISRLRVNKQGKEVEKSRQVLCMYCFEPSFFSLSGKSSIVMHLEFHHPQEVPLFVILAMKELGLHQYYEPRSKVKRKLDRLQLLGELFSPHIKYRLDGLTNQIRITPHRQASPIMKLASINESHLIPWYTRDIRDFDHYDHLNVRYMLNPRFDANNPKVCQIIRYLVDEEERMIENTMQFMCLHCQVPVFYPVSCCLPLFCNASCKLHEGMNLGICKDFPDLKEAVMKRAEEKRVKNIMGGDIRESEDTSEDELSEEKLNEEEISVVSVNENKEAERASLSIFKKSIFSILWISGSKSS